MTVARKLPKAPAKFMKHILAFVLAVGCIGEPPGEPPVPGLTHVNARHYSYVWEEDDPPFEDRIPAELPCIENDDPSIVPYSWEDLNDERIKICSYVYLDGVIVDDQCMVITIGSETCPTNDN